MTNDLIDGLVADLEPAQPLSPRTPAALVAIITVLLALAMVSAMGLRADIAAGNPQTILLLRGGVLFLMGVATLAAVVSAARPGVGNANDGWRWALAFAGLFPAGALVTVLLQGALPMDILTAESARYCLGVGTLGAFAVGVPLTAWLRKGAVTNPARAGWLVGFAAGAFSIFAYNLHCPSNTLVYAGIWYTSAVGLSALLGRLLVPRFLRW